MPLDVLTPVAPRRRRRRYRTGRVLLVLLLVLAAAGAGLWLGRREATTTRHPSFVQHPKPKPPPAQKVSHRHPTAQPPAR
ncbi:MAG TPA: hypothetical protein VGP56_03295, partial [Gaiellaceae bacterium]|nr:hypothetical protein [Gaiellaceae bacterium]